MEKNGKLFARVFSIFMTPWLDFDDWQVENIPHGYESFYFIPLDVIDILNIQKTQFGRYRSQLHHCNYL